MAAQKTKMKLRPPVGDLRDRKALMAHNPAPADVLEKAAQVVDQALLYLGLGASVSAQLIYQKCHHQVATTAIPTAAVTLLADNTAMLLYNPHFMVSLQPGGANFILFHEARHLLMRHLYSAPHLRNDPRWKNSTEANINYVAMKRLGVGMPEAEVEMKDASGNLCRVVQPTGVDPRKLYKGYAENLTKQGLEPVTYEAFMATDHACYSELCRMTEDSESAQKAADMAGQCIHGSAEGEGENGSSGDPVPSNEDTLGELGEQVLHTLVEKAAAGNKKARDELLELVDRTDGADERLTKMWGDLGVGRLRGETLATRRVDWWKRWLNDTLASKLQEGERLTYVKKRGAIDMVLGNDTMLMRRGMEDLKVVLFAIDTSGSMSAEIIDYLTKLVGYTDGVEDHWLAFDGVVMPFQRGERVHGGGGTDFGNVMEYAEGRLEVNGKKLDQHPDAIIMLTDGYAAPIRPQEPDKWIWLITDNGDADWIAAQTPAMDHHRIRTGDGIES